MDPDEVIVNGVARSECKKLCNLENDTNTIILRFNKNITTCEKMFFNMDNLTEIDLSNFHTENVISMNHMFRNCYKLSNINFGNIDTSKVKTMEYVFMGCFQLKFIDLSKFDTSSLESSREMFNFCSALISLDLSNFITTNLNNIFEMFANCQKLIYLNLSTFDISKVSLRLTQKTFFNCSSLKYADLRKFTTSSINSDTFMYAISTAKYFIENALTNGININIDCSDFCFQENTIFDLNIAECKCNELYKFEYNNTCYKNCPNGMLHIKYDKYTCSSSYPENYYLDNNDNIYKQCYSKCKSCSKAGDNLYHNCDLCEDGLTLINDIEAVKNNCYQKCQNYYYFYFDSSNSSYLYACTENCKDDYNKIIEPKKKCINYCKNDDTYKYEYDNKFYDKCPQNTKTYEDLKICLDSCYDEQFEYNKTCYNNCPNNTYRLFESRNICVVNVPENFYLDENDNIYKKCYSKCKSCSKYGNDINHNCDECINDFKFLNDSFSQKNNCYQICPYYYYFENDNNYKCTEYDQCNSNYNRLIISRNQCIDDCKKDYEYIYEYNNTCLMQCDENLKIDVDTKHCLKNCYDNQFIFKEFCYNDFPTNNSELFEDGNIFINNLTNFDDILTNIILSAYSPEIGNKLVIQRPDETIFQITNSKNELELLKDKSNNTFNMSIIDLAQCEILLKKENNINENDSLIFIKSEIKTKKVSEKNIKYDVYNPYNKEKLNISICEQVPVNIYFPMELSEGTKEMYEQMKNSGYDMFNINDPFYQDICTPFDSPTGTDILLSDRIDYIFHNDDTKCQSNCQYSQYSIESKYLSCSCSINENENIEHKKSDKFNPKKIYESFFEVLKYSNYDILKCYNIIMDINVIKINIGSIFVIINFSYFLICLFIFIFRGLIPLKIKLRNELYNEQKKYNLIFKYNINEVLYSSSKKKFIPKIIPKNNEIKINKKIFIFTAFKSNFKDKISPKSKINSNTNSKLNIFDRTPVKILYKNKLNKYKQNRLIKYNKKIIPKKEYSDYELNELEYDEAIKFDKRSLCEIYWQTLKREHLIFFTFFNCGDYNLLNVFFFSDDSMHKLFLSYGKYDFIQQIPQITYSTIISQIIEVFLCFLSLTDKYCYEIKSNFIKGNKGNIAKLFNCIYIKLIYFFRFILIFFGIYWYIISVFCGIYRNTQIIFIKDSIISFTVGLLYPFIFYLISVSLRVCSLRNSKKRCKYVYKFSYIIPFF